jgi:hypothetical protein
MVQGAEGAGQAQAIKAVQYAGDIGLVFLDKRVWDAVRIGGRFVLPNKLLP